MHVGVWVGEHSTARCELAPAQHPPPHLRNAKGGVED